MHHHDHHHGGSDMNGMDKDKAIALLKYNLEHNVHHAHELHDLAHELEHLGLNEAAEQVGVAYSLYKEGNEALKKAVDSL